MSPGRGESLRFLVADGEASFATSVADSLEAAHEAVTAEAISSEREVIEQGARISADAIIVGDTLQTPVETIARLTNGSDRPVVLLTDSTSREPIPAAIEAGVTDVLPRVAAESQYELLIEQLSSEQGSNGDSPGANEDANGSRSAAERAYRSVFENVSDGLVVHDPETGEIVDVNERFCEMNGYERAELIGKDIGIVTAPAEEYSYEAAYERIEAARTEGPQLFEWRNQRRTGETFPVEVHLSVVRLQGEQRVLASVRDISERKRREQRLKVFNRILRHNLRNRVDVIKSHAAELADRTDGHDATRISTAADRLAAIAERARKTDQFMSRERNETTVNLSERIGTILDSIGNSDRHVTITRDLPKRSTLVTDGEVIDVVLENALDNAIQYAESSVEVTVESVPDGYEISITDDGPGIPSEELSPLDARTETDLQHGRGLGLWQLKWGVQKLNGRLSFDVSRGTIVQITIPDLRADGRHQ
ncbi:PAS domain S-box protein [Halostella salina]|uniref:PAS domain S-box protein n=1 Tax=Halostella salina TaxID=1547897 RepID=UPI001F08C4CD|nr:PAS domain S-box protein [Halostella salina]